MADMSDTERLEYWNKRLDLAMGRVSSLKRELYTQEAANFKLGDKSKDYVELWMRSDWCVMQRGELATSYIKLLPHDVYMEFTRKSIELNSESIRLIKLANALRKQVREARGA